jgi:hypothetical protein
MLEHFSKTNVYIHLNPPVKETLYIELVAVAPGNPDYVESTPSSSTRSPAATEPSGSESIVTPPLHPIVLIADRNPLKRPRSPAPHTAPWTDWASVSGSDDASSSKKRMTERPQEPHRPSMDVDVNGIRSASLIKRGDKSRAHAPNLTAGVPTSDSYSGSPSSSHPGSHSIHRRGSADILRRSDHSAAYYESLGSRHIPEPPSRPSLLPTISTPISETPSPAWRHRPQVTTLAAGTPRPNSSTVPGPVSGQGR